MNYAENRRYRAFTDWFLILMVFGLSLFGIFVISVATFSPGAAETDILNHILSSDSAMRQVFFVFFVSPIVVVAMLNAPYQLIKSSTTAIWVIGTAFLTVTWVFNGAEGVKAWLDIIWGYTLQPSELIKFAIILSVAKQLSEEERPLTSLKSFARLGFFVGIPSVVILASGEMGSLLVIVFFIAIMLFFGNVPIKVLVGILITGLVAVAVLIVMMMLFDPGSYRLARLLAFVNPEQYSATDAYQQNQSKMAIGSGGFFGIGTYVNGSMSQLNYVPADWTDFIFSAIGEAFGFLGCMIIMLVYLAIIFRMMSLALHTRDRFGMLVIYGVAGMLLFHVFENIGMNIGAMPITGIPLPFLSYGGSNMVTNMAGVGLVLNVTRNRSLSHTIAAPQVTRNPVFFRK